jgi:hypothetical protein
VNEPVDEPVFTDTVATRRTLGPDPVVVGHTGLTELDVPVAPPEAWTNDRPDPAVTSKEPAEQPVPAAFVTQTWPSVAPVGTLVEIVVSFVKLTVAAVPLNVTAEAPVKCNPVNVTGVPGGPEVGLNPVTTGCWTTVKLAELHPVFPDAVTQIGPDVAPTGTVTVSCVSEPGVKLALVPSNVTADAPANAEPFTVTAAPTPPDPGLKLVTCGPGGGSPAKVAMTPDQAWAEPRL